MSAQRFAAFCTALMLISGTGAGQVLPVATDSGTTATERASPPRTALDGTWRLIEIDGHAAPEGVTLKLADGGFSGRGGCNRYFGTITPGSEADGYHFGAIGATRMSCGDAIDAQEMAFLKALAEVVRGDVMPASAGHPAQLLLHYGTARPLGELVFEPATDN